MAAPTTWLGRIPALLTDVPVDPDAQTARRWLREELADPIYHERPSLLATVLDWVVRQLERAQQAVGQLDVRTAAVIVAVVLAVGAGSALLVAGPVRRAARERRASVDVFGDDARSTAELRASADAFAAQQRWAEAVLDRFRAILRSLEDRVVLDPRPGRTAHEAAEEATVRLPSCADDLRRAAVLFDDVCYGDNQPGRDDDAWLREVDRRVGAARPVPLDEVAAAHAPAVPR